MIRQVLTVFLSIILLSSGAFSQKNNLLDSPEFEKQINQAGIQILDVRTPEEYSSGHIKDALLADWLNKEEFARRVQYLDKTKPLYVYCGSGVRSSEATKWLLANGFQQVSGLRNGFIAWKKSNKPIESDVSAEQISVAEYYSLLDTSSLVLVDFGAKWCPPCKKMEPVLEQLQKELNTKFTLIKIDAGIHTNIMQELKVDLLPTFLLYKDGKEIWRKQGLVSLDEFKSYIQ